MLRPSVENMLSNKETRYALVIAVAKRARQIAADFETNQVITDEKPVMLAIDEFKSGKFAILEPDINE